MKVQYTNQRSDESLETDNNSPRIKLETLKCSCLTIPDDDAAHQLPPETGKQEVMCLPKVLILSSVFEKGKLNMAGIKYHIPIGHPKRSFFPALSKTI